MRAKLLLPCILWISTLACVFQSPGRAPEASVDEKVRVHPSLARIPLTRINETTSHPLAQYQGKLTVVFLTSTQCKDCVKLHPRLNQLKQRFPQSQVSFLALFIDESQDEIKNLLNLYPLSYNVFILKEQHLRDFGVTRLPAHLVINRDWEVVFRLEGSHQDPLPLLEHEIRRFL